MFHLENDTLKLAIAASGAELKSVYHKAHRLEYMWDANPAFWAKTSPVLFPIVGTLKDDTYRYNGQQYHLSRHGFARDKTFSVTNTDDNSLALSLESDEETLAVYPFPFLFSLVYTLTDNQLSVAYRVENRGNGPLLFSVGAHPAFRVPLVPGTAYDDYQLLFNREETTGRWPITSDGLIGNVPKPLLQGTTELPLSKSLFAKDALVLKGLASDSVRIVSDKTEHGLNFSFAGFPYLGLWAAPGADFLCIEPWCGIADSVHADGELSHKEGIHTVAPGDKFSVAWKATFY